MEDFFRKIGMPTNIRELGIENLTDKHIDGMVDKCSFGGKSSIGGFVKLEADDMRKIYQMARG